MKIAIITGASAGIGRASAEEFVKQGFQVFNIARRKANLAGVTDLQCDLADPAARQGISQTLRDILAKATQVSFVHNACRMAKDTVDHCDVNDLSITLEVNIAAPNHLNQIVLPLLPSGSSLIYIGSTLSEKAVANSFSYVTSKHAVIGMMRATCQDLKGRGIHTCCICPGFTDTEMLRTHVGDDPNTMKFIASLNTFDRMIEPKEIASLVLWAHNNPVINGSVLHANLGQIES
jgi:3-oxoacyl-[acyl-carrier protein] reductase